MTNITGGGSTMSRQPGRRPMRGVTHGVIAEGCRILTCCGDKNEWLIDAPMGQHGPVLGYNPDWLTEQLRMLLITKEAVAGSYIPLVEEAVADQLCHIFPDVESVRFGKNGSDVCAASVRLARAVTGRDKIVAFGYHGNDAEFVHPPQNRGVPQCLQDTVTWFEWGAIPKWGDYTYGGNARIKDDVACVIVEVPPTDDYEQTVKYLRELCYLAHKHGALFILDEVVTGFRFALGGASEYYGVKPDLYCWGKAMSNGHIVSALGGRNDLMKEFQNGVFFSGTFFDDPFGLHATNLTLDYLMRHKDEVYPHLWAMGERLKVALNDLAQIYKVDMRCVGQAPRTVLEFGDIDTRNRFNLLCLDKGVLYDRPQFMSTAFGENELVQCVEAADYALRKISEG